MQFQQVEKKFRQLKSQFEAGAISETEFKAQLEELMVQDERGNWWMIGYETERWYHHDGTTWVQADPPASPSPISIPFVSATTQNEEGITPVVSSKPAVKDNLPAIAATRRSFFFIAAVIAAICITLSVSGYYMLNAVGQGPIQASSTTQPSSTTKKDVQSIADVSVTQSSKTSKPTIPASQTPRPTSTPQVEFQLLISVSQANLYKGPGPQYGLVQRPPYEKGEKFTALARDPSGLWLLASAIDGSEGWLYMDWVDVDFDPLLVPTAESIPPLPPTPTRRAKDNNPNPGCVFNC